MSNNAEDIISPLASDQGWNDFAQLRICLAFIAAHVNLEDFRDFINGWAEEENACNEAEEE